MNCDARIASIALHMKFPNCFRTLLALALSLAASVSSLRAAEKASATLSSTQLNSTTWKYDVVLNDIGTTNLGTFWLAWVPGENFMPSNPTNISSPTSWTANITGGGSGDGYAIQWIAGSGAALASGKTLTGFSFESTTSPATMAGLSPLFGQAILTSFVYSGAPFSDGGFQFQVQPASVSNSVSIMPNGIVPIYSKSTTIQAGSWVSIYGSALATANTTWNGNFPTNLNGTTVTINNKLAYLWYVSPGQINLQAPDDTATGTVPVVVTTSTGSATSTVTLGQFGPSFSLLDSTHVAGIIVRTDGSGAYGGGTYDIIGPTGNSLGYATVAPKGGDTIELFGVGFGTTNPPVLAGQVPPPLAGGNPAANEVRILIGGTSLTPSFAGINGEAGLFQFNLTLPAGLGTGDVALVGIVGGVQTPAGAVISLDPPSGTSTPPPYY
jgi:uncharacterized protein (TIGR03437 family)